MRNHHCSEEESREVKRCGRCQKHKPLTEFGFEKKRGRYRCYCHECRRVRPDSPRIGIRDRTEKLCPRCKQVKLIAEFRREGDGDNREAPIWHYCRGCNRDECRERGQEKIKSGEARLGYKKRYKTKRWEKLLKQYGVTQKQYEAMEAAQNGLCAICRQPETIMYKDVLCRLVVDHDHKTDKIRGLLCRACNIALGNFRDDPERLRRAINYLRLHSS